MSKTIPFSLIITLLILSGCNLLTQESGNASNTDLQEKKTVTSIGNRDTIDNSGTCAEEDEIYTWTNYEYHPIYQSYEKYLESLTNSEDDSLENPGKVTVTVDYKLVGDKNRGIHIYDRKLSGTDAHVAFINIPGNADMAVKNNTLYADSYDHLLALDISNITDVRLEKALPESFERDQWNYGYRMLDPDSGLIVDWKIDTVVYRECGMYRAYSEVQFSLDASSSSSNNEISTGGSMSRFVLNNNFLYAVDQNTLHLFNVKEDANPMAWSSQPLDWWGIETIYMEGGALFIGSQTGMYIYDISNPGNPVFASEFSHATSCDPVVVQNDLAYVTLRSGTSCRMGNNELNIVDVSDLTQPRLIKTYAMLSPHGLAIQDNILVVCEGAGGFKIFDASDPNDLQLLKMLDGLHAYDVILQGAEALIIGNDGLYTYDISDPSNPVQVSHVEADGQNLSNSNQQIVFRSPQIWVQ